jgi:hypothetical protein
MSDNKHILQVFVFNFNSNFLQIYAIFLNCTQTDENFNTPCTENMIIILFLSQVYIEPAELASYIKNTDYEQLLITGAKSSIVTVVSRRRRLAARAANNKREE